MNQKTANRTAKRSVNEPTGNSRTGNERAAEIGGLVEYRLGDGPRATVPQGPVTVTTTDIDATLSWQDGETHASASIPLADFRRYVADGAITLQEVRN